jgi:hypothetical protein
MFILFILGLLCRRYKNKRGATGPCVQDFIMWHNQEIRDFERRRASNFHDHGRGAS